jgi:hypothetical protein
MGRKRDVRALNDVDVVIESFASIPEALVKEFLIRHIHPKVPEGKMLIQLVDPNESLRIDIFRGYGATMARSQPLCFGTSSIQVVSLEDLAARAASLLMDLELGASVARKYAQDFQILMQVINFDRIETAWRDYRKATNPSTFKEALPLIHDLLDSRSELLVTPEYSHDVDAVCPVCEETGSFRPVSPIAIMSILGYC